MMMAILFLNCASKYLESHTNLEWWDRWNFASFLIPWDEQKNHELLHGYEMNMYILQFYYPWQVWGNVKTLADFLMCTYLSNVTKIIHLSKEKHTFPFADVTLIRQSVILCTMDICGESCWKNLSAPSPSSACKHHWLEDFLSMDSRT